MGPKIETDLTKAVRDRYARAARDAASGGVATCGDDCGCQTDPVTRDLYGAAEVAGLPAEALTASLGCGNPTALAQLEPGQTVLDLGSGGGIDVLLSARRVGPEGKAYGLDMTDEMLELARANQARAGVTNVEFLKGQIEDIPLPDDSVDVIISNCVINLSGDKERVVSEAFRVSPQRAISIDRPSGKLAERIDAFDANAVASRVGAADPDVVAGVTRGAEVDTEHAPRAYRNRAHATCQASRLKTGSE